MRANLAHRMTAHIQKQLTVLGQEEALGAMPPILAFQSSVDATVTASSLVANLFDRVPPANHELVLFDINRRIKIGILLQKDPRTVFEPLLNSDDRSFDLTILTIESS